MGTTVHTNRNPDPCSDSLPTIRPGAEEGGVLEEEESPGCPTTISQTSFAAGKSVAEAPEVVEVRPFQCDHSSRPETT
jgi:hypothetical protein